MDKYLDRDGLDYFWKQVKTYVDRKFVHVYGVEFDWENGNSTRGLRTDDSALFSDPEPALNNGTGSSPFDTLYPWCDMVKEERDGGIEVKEPKYWFKWTKKGKKLKLQIADGPLDGFHVDPVNMDRGDGLGELDFSYIGRYHCSTEYKSEADKMPKNDVSRIDARAGIHSLGDNFWQVDFAQFWYIGMLYLVEFADWNSQYVIGYGCSNNTDMIRVNNGQTDAMEYHTGTTTETRDTYGYTQYRNIEGWWDNILDHLDGCYCTDDGLNVIMNPSQFDNDDAAVVVGRPPDSFWNASNSSDHYPTDFSIPTQKGFEWALFPSERGGGYANYSSDMWSFDPTFPDIVHGASALNGRGQGIFYVWNVNFPVASNVGCRLQERPPKVLT